MARASATHQHPACTPTPPPKKTIPPHQNDFLRPFVVVMRQSQVRPWCRKGRACIMTAARAPAPRTEGFGRARALTQIHSTSAASILLKTTQPQSIEIRELIIRCLSQMVLARVDNIKSGWKSMFMVFTTAAGDPGATGRAPPSDLSGSMPCPSSRVRGRVAGLAPAGLSSSHRQQPPDV